MRASILDLRYKMNDVLKALDRNEVVDILYHGKLKAKLFPCNLQQKKKLHVKDHPLFGMGKKDKKSVQAVINDLRGNRYDIV
jgi:hypothetical protein